MDAAGCAYFLKLVYSAAHRGIFERSFPVVQHLNDHGIGFISRIVKTRDGRLSAFYDGAAAGLFHWIDGENFETDETKIPEYDMLARVYAVPADGLDIRREDFAGSSAGRFFAQWDVLDDPPTRALFERRRDVLECRAGRLRRFAGHCQGDAAAFYITHGDAGGNLITGGDGRLCIVDWDDPMLAPPERDAWVMCGKPWAKCVFEKALRRHGISHILRSKWLAYYCYHYFFWYLTEFLNERTDAGIIAGYLDGWITESLAYADNQ